MVMRKTGLLNVLVVTGAILPAGGALGACTSDSTDGAPERTGRAMAAIDQAPANALCLQIEVRHINTITTSSFDLAPEANTTFALQGLPLGTDAFSASAFDAPCASLGSAAPTWVVTNPVLATVVPNPPVSITLQMHPAGDSGASGSGVVEVSFPAAGPGCYRVIQEYSSFNGPPSTLTAGPDGNIWFAGSGGFDAITTTGNLFTPGTFPGYGAAGVFTSGPDGNLWLTDPLTNQIIQITPATPPLGLPHQFFSVPTTQSALAGIAPGPDGNLWFTEIGGNKIGVINPNGTLAMIQASIQEFNVPTASARPVRIAAGSDGNLWFTERNGGKIGVIIPTGGASSIREFTLPTATSAPIGITAGADGNLWFAEFLGNQIGVISPTGGAASIQEFAIPTAAAEPLSITAGPDGRLWFTENKTGKIGVITPGGGAASIEEFSLPSAASNPTDIVAGPDGKLWFAESGVGKVASITPFPVCPAADAGAPPAPDAGPPPPPPPLEAGAGCQSAADCASAGSGVRLLRRGSARAEPGAVRRSFERRELLPDRRGAALRILRGVPERRSVRAGWLRHHRLHQRRCRRGRGRLNESGALVSSRNLASSNGYEPRRP
jgi:streptogramin lyase